MTTGAHGGYQPPAGALTKPYVEPGYTGATDDPSFGSDAGSGSTTQTAKDQAGNVASTASDEAKNVAAEAKSQARNLANETQNQVRDTVAPSGGDAFGIAADRATSAILSGNLVKNTSSVAISGILVTRATRASVTLNTLDSLDYGVVFTGGARGTCEGNRMTVVATPTMGVTCEP